MIRANPRVNPRSTGLLTLAVLAGLGAIVGISVAVLGLMLAGGGVRYVLAFVIIGGVTLAASRWKHTQAFADAKELIGRSGLLLLAVAFGTGFGLLLFGRVERPPAARLLLLVAAFSLAAFSGVSAALLAGKAISRRGLLVGLMGTALAGTLIGMGLGRIAPWAIAKFYLWGLVSGAGLAASLDPLARSQTADPSGGTEPPRRASTLGLFATVLILLINGAMPGAWDDTGKLNPYVFQASSFLAGRLDIDMHLERDVANFGGKTFLPFHPFPALVLLPFAWFWRNAGPSAPVLWISAVIGALSAVLLKSVLDEAGVPARAHLWIIAAFVFGTGFWLVLTKSDGSAPYSAHVVAVPCLLLALREALGRGRGLLAGLYLGLAFLSRPLTILGVFVLVPLLLEGGPGRATASARLNLAWFALALAACVGLDMGFNYLRFGNVLDNGYAHQVVWGTDEARRQQFGLFSPAYVPANLYHTFLHGFNVEFQPPLLLRPEKMDPLGTSLTVASPFLFLALLARGRAPFVWGAWCSIGLMLFAHLLWASNGSLQINTQRFMLDYLPILILLVGLGAPRVRPALVQGLVLYSVGLNLIALFIVPWLR